MYVLWIIIFLVITAQGCLLIGCKIFLAGPNVENVLESSAGLWSDKPFDAKKPERWLSALVGAGQILVYWIGRNIYQGIAAAACVGIFACFLIKPNVHNIVIAICAAQIRRVRELLVDCGDQMAEDDTSDTSEMRDRLTYIYQQLFLLRKLMDGLFTDVTIATLAQTGFYAIGSVGAALMCEALVPSGNPVAVFIPCVMSIALAVFMIRFLNRLASLSTACMSTGCNGIFGNVLDLGIYVAKMSDAEFKCYQCIKDDLAFRKVGAKVYSITIDWVLITTLTCSATASIIALLRSLAAFMKLSN